MTSPKKQHFNRKGAGEYFDILNLAVERGVVLVVVRGGRGEGGWSEESERWSQQPERNSMCNY